MLAVSACGDYTIHVSPEKEGDDPGECSDSADNDEDGLFDCDDEDCFAAPECQPNQLPTAPVVVIEPILPYTGDTLTCQISQPAVDPDAPEGTPMEHTVSWAVNGTDAGVDSFAVDAELTSRSDVWTCSVVGWDGDETGAPGTASVTVTNKPPPAPEVAVMPGFPTDGQDLTCTITAQPEDEDGDELTYQYTWLKDGVESGHSSDLVPWYETAAYEEWACHVTPNDSIDDGLASESKPIQVVVDGVQFVSAGKFHSCAVTNDGNSICWGFSEDAIDSEHNHGQVGDLTQHTGAGEVSAGELHTCVLAYGDATVACWGAGASNTGTAPHLGQGMSPEMQGTFIQVSAGYDHNCGVKSNGQLHCWGSSSSWGTEDTALPPSTDTPETFAREVASGDRFSCVRRVDGSLHCWGESGSPMIAEDPPEAEEDRMWVQLSAGGSHACALDDAGSITCWGNDDSGQSSVPPDILFSQVSAGHAHTCAVEQSDTGEGPVHCWGEDASGKLDAPSETFTQVSAGWSHTCGRRSDYTVACWGCSGTDEDLGQCTVPAF